MEARRPVVGPVLGVQLEEKLEVVRAPGGRRRAVEPAVAVLFHRVGGVAPEIWPRYRSASHADGHSCASTGWSVALIFVRLAQMAGHSVPA